ncbi:NAP family protein [Vairimorpha necatrix]|uniref:NAP family protein n=1 Tax=Vairimorpha necatrix TaxID=6039 RepID=A0AAX4JBP1_9MICR
MVDLNNNNMNNDNNNESKNILEDIQHELEIKDRLHQKKEFDLALEGYNNIKSLLSRRDDLLLSTNSFSSFWSRAFDKFDVSLKILPRKDKKLDLSWLKSFKVEFRDNYKSVVRMELFPNEYVKNEILEKELGVYENEVERSKVEWKGEERSLIFQFFDSDESEFEMFDFLYEIYKNGIFYYLLEDE